MTVVNHSLTIDSTVRHGARPTPDIVGSILTQIKPAVQESVRMAFLRSSKVVGRPSKELQAASDIRFVGIGAGENDKTLLHFEAPRLIDAAPEIFGQRDLLGYGPKQEDTCFNLFGDAVIAVKDQALDSESYDEGLLRRIGRFRETIRKQNINEIRLSGDRLSLITPPVISPDLIKLSDSLLNRTPQPKRVRIQGRFDMIRISDRVFEIILEDESRIRAVWNKSRMISLSPFLGKEVLVEGEAVFRPSGKLLRIDAEGIVDATYQDKFFSKMPRPTEAVSTISSKQIGKRQNVGFKGLFGKWPGDETEEELLEFLEEIS